MKVIDEETGYFRIYAPEETREEFAPLRERIFDTLCLGMGFSHERIFRDPSWVKVIIRGSVLGSDRTDESREEAEELGGLEFFDPRDELRPLFDVLIEDGIDEIIHMRPWGKEEEQDAVVTLPTRSGMWRLFERTFALLDTDRVIFDHTGRWGFYGSVEEFGLLGGEPEFLARYIEKAGGMGFIREKADVYWQAVMDDGDFEAPFVPHYYELAGWDNPPRKRETGQDEE